MTLSPELKPARSAEQVARDDRHARMAALLSLIVSIILLALKFWAFRLTQSQAVFSDAMETIVNVVASGLALIVIGIAQKPADQDHPYGHGKVEFFSAAFEGGLIAFASVLICVEAIHAMIRGPQIEKIGFGLGITVLSAIVNGALGYYLLRSGRRHLSATLEASGQHVLADVWTSVGVVVGLLTVHFTGTRYADPAVALIVGLFLGWTGIVLVRRSIGGLLDAEDRGILENLMKILATQQTPGIIQLHHIRVMRSGRYHHIDGHCVVPEFWDISEAHERTEAFEAALMKSYTHPGELHLHVDPCRRAYCRSCDLQNCPVRKFEFVAKRELSIAELTNPEEPD